MAYSRARISIPNVTGNIVITATAAESAPPTNLINTVGYTSGMRISLGSAVANKEVAQVGWCVTGLIPVVAGDVIKIRGFDMSGGMVCATFNSSETYIDGKNGIGDTQSETGAWGTIARVSDYYQYTFDSNASSSTAYFKISGTCADGSVLYAVKNDDLPD